MTTESMDITDRKLLNMVQSNFPMVEEPYREIAADLEISEAELLERLTELKRQNVVRQISAIFDTRRLGYKTTLVAFAYGDGDLHDGAIFINRHPGSATTTPGKARTTTCGSRWPCRRTATCRPRWNGWRKRPTPSSSASCPPSGSSRSA